MNCIKTPDHCDEILRLRVESTRVLGEAMRVVTSPPRVWVQMSTAHIYIVTSPNPVSQVDFMRTLRKVIKMPVGLPAFEWMVRIGAPLFLRTDPELALYGRYVVSKRLADAKFDFQFPELEPALRDVYAQSRR